MSRTLLSQDDLASSYNEQIEFLKKSCEDFDAGNMREAKRMAVVIRTLCCPTKAQKSLLDRVGLLKNTNFYDSVGKGADKLSDGEFRIGGNARLVSVSLSGEYLAYLDNPAPGGVSFVPFQEFWHRPVIEAEGETFTREELVRFVADQDGGAHVDSALTEKYARLSRNNAMGWVASPDGNKFSPIEGIELASIRQIGHELLRSLVKNYPKQIPILRRGLPGIGSSIKIF